MGWCFLAGVLLLSICVLGLPLPQGGGAAGAHGQPQAGSPSTPGPGGPGSPVGPGSAGGAIGSLGPVRRGRGWWDWHRRDPTLFKGLWASREPKGPLDSLGNAEVYIVLALLIGFVTVVIGCWLSDNCWSPEPEGVVTLA